MAKNYPMHMQFSKFNPQDVLDSLSPDDEKRINDEIRQTALEREQGRYSRLEKAKIAKQALVQELEMINYEIAENDEWFIEAKEQRIEVTTEDENLHRRKAGELYSRKKPIVDQLLPAAESALRSLVAQIEKEEQQEPNIQQRDRNRLLELIYEKREHERSRKIAAQLRQREEEKSRRQQEEAAFLARKCEALEQTTKANYEKYTMPIIDSIKSILGFTPRTAGELNRHATHQTPMVKSDVRAIDPLPEIEVTEEYKRAKKLIDADVPVIFVTGKAGTGKSTFINYIRNNIAKQVVVLAPTGVAALNVQGATINSFFRFPPHALSSNDIQKVEDRKLYTHLDVLILDEVSMIRADVIDAIDMFLRLNGKDCARPFGGTQVVMVGDLFQLPPVVTTKEESRLFSRKYTSPFFFSSEAISDQRIYPVELERVFRQQDQTFVDILNRIRLGDASDDVLKPLNARLTVPSPVESPIVLTPTNAGADRINNDEMNGLTGDVSEYEGEIKGKPILEEDKLPSPMRLRLKVNAKVMFTKNDNDRRWINGSLGTVTEMKPDSIIVKLEDMGHVYVQRVSWEKYKYVYDETNNKIYPKVVASYTQFPLMPAWAITIHKSQGKTLPAVKVDLGEGAFAAGQTYVALSRARKLEDVWLGRAIKSEDIFCDQRIRQFYDMMFNRALDHGWPPVAPMSSQMSRRRWQHAIQ